MDNRVAKEGKGTSIAILNVVGQCGPLLGTRLYPSSDGPWYVRGMATCSVFMVIVAGLAFVLRVVLRRENVSRVSEGGGGDDEGVELGETHGEEREELMGGGGGGPGGGNRRLDYTPEKRFTYIL